jgi:hypothetical protein
LIEHEIFDILDPLDLLHLLHLLDLLDLLATDSDLPFKELINFTIFDDLTDAEVMPN